MCDKNNPMTSISEIATRLNDDCERLGVHLLGEPNKRLCSSRELRWGDHGRLSLSLEAPYRGKWHDWSSDEYGGMLDLIELELSLHKSSALKWAKEWLGTNLRPIKPTAVASKDNPSKKKRGQLALSIWEEAAPISGTLSNQYLTVERGLPLPDDILAADAFRHHGSLYFLGKTVPGMVALMRDPVSAEPVGIQRTFLTPGGKKIERRMLGSAGVVMLSPSEEVEYGLCLAEGMENALAAMTIGGWRPMWAAMSAGGIRSFPVLDGIESLIVFADHDQVGMDAAGGCCKRWSDTGRATTIVPPPMPGDWNDVLRKL